MINADLVALYMGRIFLTAVIISMMAVIFTTPVAWAQASEPGFQIELSASSTSVELGENFSVVLTIQSVSGINGLNLGGVEIPGLDNFIQTSVSNRTETQINGGQSLFRTSTSRLVSAQSEGVFQIGPIAATVDENGLSAVSNTLTITVGEGNPVISASTGKKDKVNEFTDFSRIYNMSLWALIITTSTGLIYLYIDPRARYKTKSTESLNT